MQTTIVYIIFAIGSLFVLSRRSWLSGLGLACAAWIIYFPDAIYHSGASRNENIVLGAIVFFTTLLLIFLRGEKIRIVWRNWWVRLVCYIIIVMIVPWTLLGALSLYSAVLYPMIFLFLFVAASFVKKWQAIFWAISWLIIFNIATNYVGVPGWPWEVPLILFKASKNIKFNLNIAYEAMWLSLLLGVSLAFSNWKPKHILLLSPFFIYFIVAWLMHWSRSLTISSGVLLALIPFITKKAAGFRSRAVLSTVILAVLVLNYYVIVPWVLDKGFWLDSLTQTRIEEKLMQKIVTDETRVRLFKTTFNLWRESPIWGVGFFRSGEIVFGQEGDGPHSGLLMLLAEGGLLAVGMFMLGLKDILVRIKPWASTENNGELELRNMVFLGIVSLLPRMMFDGIFYNTPMLAILIITGYHIEELTRDPIVAPAKTTPGLHHYQSKRTLT